MPNPRQIRTGNHLAPLALCPPCQLMTNDTVAERSLPSQRLRENHCSFQLQSMEASLLFVLPLPGCHPPTCGSCRGVGQHRGSPVHLSTSQLSLSLSLTLSLSLSGFQLLTTTCKASPSYDTTTILLASVSSWGTEQEALTAMNSNKDATRTSPPLYKQHFFVFIFPHTLPAE